MYCNGNCEFLDKKRKKCKADGTIIAVMKVRGKTLSYDCYEHRVGCVKDREEAEVKLKEMEESHD